MIVVIFQIKNIILIVALSFFLVAYVFYKNSPTTQEMIDAPYYDYYSYAIKLRTTYKFDLLSFFLVSIYALKYFQLFSSLSYLFKGFKKSTFDYLMLFFTTSVNFLGMSLLTTFVFGSFIFEYRNFERSIVTNIKIFIFVDDSEITKDWYNYYRIFTIVVIIIFTLIIRYILLNMFNPIFIEYERIEIEKIMYSRKINMKSNSSNSNFPWKESKLYILN
jgi:hypothetical protein